MDNGAHHLSILKLPINSIIHHELEQQGIIAIAEQQANILVVRQDMTGAERKFALAYVAHEELIHYLLSNFSATAESF